MAKNVGAKKTGEKVPKVKTEKVEYPGNRNENGKLTMLPGDDYNSKQHKSLKKSDFADGALYLDYRANLLDARLSKQRKAIESMREQAGTLRKFGDENTRKKVDKIRRMREAVQSIAAELRDQDGFDQAALDEMLAGFGATDSE